MSPHHTPGRRHWRRLACPFLLALFVVSLQAANTGLLTGSVSNSATGNMLEGAKVDVPALGRSVLTDDTGRYVMPDLPAGTYEVVASYVGLDLGRETVVVPAGGRTTHDFALTSSIYKLEQFKVTGEREGSAAAITAQRNAPNVKNVVAMDQFGNLPNMSAGELAMRLPGVAGNLDDEGNVTGLTVRGMGPTMNRVTIDGSLIANVGGLNRQFQTHSLTGAMFEELEVIKGHTPDQEADSLGGTVNLKTRSPLSMTEKRRVMYSFGVRAAPPFTQQVPLRRDHPAHPLLNLGYEEVFDAFGGHHNLGVAVNAFYSENVAGYFRTIRDYQNTTNQPAYLWDYRTQDAYNNRKQSSLNVKFDYRLSPTTKLSLDMIYNDAFEPFNRLYETRAYTNQTTPNATTSGVIPGYTNRITQVRPVASSVIDVTETMYSFYNRTRMVDLGGEHDYDRLTIDWHAVYSQMHANLGVGGGGTFTNRISGIGWTLDRTKSDLYPDFIQTAGPDITNPANYRPNGPLTARDTKRNVEISDLRANAKYDLPTKYPLAFKAGFQRRSQRGYESSKSRQWTYTGTGPLPSDPSIHTWIAQKTGLVVPDWEAAAFVHNGTPVNPSLWKEDLYYGEQQKFSPNRGVIETVTAGYGMAEGRLGRLGYLGGVRVERTEDDTWGYPKSHTPATAAQKAADPVGAADADYAGNYRRLQGHYTDAFPSMHLTYNVTSRLKAHLSWSKSFGRPAMTNLLPNESYSDAAQTLTINNPSLKPEYADNWDASLEYYFEPVGLFSVAWFHKKITDFIVTGIESGTVPSGTDNGYGGDYAGYTILTSSNAGTAYVEGWEFAYQQQFTFLPGLLKGLGLMANYTTLETHGDFGGSAYRTGNQVVGFIPQTGNLSLSWRYGRFSARLLYNYTSDYIRSYSAASPGRNQYMRARPTINVGGSFQLRRGMSLFVDVVNLTNEPQAYYRGIKDQMERTIIDGTTLTAGIEGRF
ncbi:MAG TPA: TonB-dependent receptor [Opitutaceae bacterium]|nr:TonB-dependent receptor [Opitutaceae bacterium]